MSAHPFSLLFYGLAALALVLAVRILRHPEQHGADYARIGLGLLAVLQVMAFLGAFSIGLFLALAALLIGVMVTVTAGSHRRELGLLTLSAAAIAGWWTPLVVVLRVAVLFGYATAVLYSLYRLIQVLRQGGDPAASHWGVVLAGLLGMISLLALPEGAYGLIALPVLALLVALWLAIASPRWRITAVILAAANALLIWGLALA